MLLAIMSFYGVRPIETLFVGNHEVDREAAARARTSFGWSSSFFRQPA
jgi:phosphoglycolate phosphatase-like HAD superfamily hydrolase